MDLPGHCQALNSASGRIGLFVVGLVVPGTEFSVDLRGVGLPGRCQVLNPTLGRIGLLVVGLVVSRHLI